MRGAGPTLLLAALVACGTGEAPESAPATASTAKSFADETRCAGCHPAEHAAWSGSDHDRAMQHPDATSVLGDFDDAVFEGAGIRARFFRRGDAFVVNTEGPDGEPHDFEVAYTFGVDPLQQLLLPLPGGRLQAFSVAWDARPRAEGGQRWFPLYPDDPPPPGDAYHWTGSQLTWNHQCAECHATDVRKGFDPATGGYRTVFAREDVGCQACHGPGSAHVAWAEAGSSGRGAGLVEIVDEVDACARCHARRHRVSEEDAHGRALLDDFVPETLREGLYEADGQIQDEVYVYGSFLQSRMYQAGVRCGDCHDPHTAGLRAEGDRVCLACHSETPDPRFETLEAKRYDTPEHHHHRDDSEGARCVSCHMRSRVYMGIDARRDHSLRIPRPDLTQSIGVGNACDDCHAARGTAWAARRLWEWFPGSPRRGPHYGETFAAVRRGEAQAVEPLLQLVRDRRQPAIVRATAVELLPRLGAAGLEALADAARAEPLVRVYAAAGLAYLPPADRIVVATPLLDDPLRAVRVEAAVSLSSLPAGDIPSATRTPLRAALREYVAAQNAQRDTPEANLNLGLLAERSDELARAESFYRAALALDAAFFPAHANLAQVLARQGRLDEAESTLREGIAAAPQVGALHYSLGLLLSETGRLEQGVASLERAVALLPGDVRPVYNLGLALQHLGRAEDAGRTLRRARELDPSDADVAYAVAVYHVQREEYAEALPHAEAAVALRGDPAFLELLAGIRAQLAP